MSDLDAWLTALVSALDSVDRPLADEIRAIEGSRSLTAPDAGRPPKTRVRIPCSFWKVITFVHDETGDPCATGYTMSQQDFLRDEEFVFSQHKTSQARIAAIEQRAGLSFGPLAALDPFDGDAEGVSALLTDPAQIRFLR